MSFNKENIQIGSSCVVLTTNAYGEPIVKRNGKVEKIGFKYISIKVGKNIYKFNFDMTVYKGLVCVEENLAHTFLFKDEADMNEYICREKYIKEIKKLFNNDKAINLSLLQLKQIHDLLKKEKMYGTK